LREPSRRLGAEEPGPDGYTGEVRLVAGALGNLARAPDQTLWVARGVDDGLRVEVDDRTLLLSRLCHGFTEFSSFGKVLGAGASGGVGLKEHAYRENAQIIRARRDRNRRNVRDRRASRRLERTTPLVRNGLAAASAAMT
jgi:hypothetical protein